MVAGAASWTVIVGLVSVPDGSHPPTRLPLMAWDALQHGADDDADAVPPKARSVP
jgi:hypothetical protein